jgi:hypothetical protein
MVRWLLLLPVLLLLLLLQQHCAWCWSTRSAKAICKQPI